MWLARFKSELQQIDEVHLVVSPDAGPLQLDTEVRTERFRYKCFVSVSRGFVSKASDTHMAGLPGVQSAANADARRPVLVPALA